LQLSIDHLLADFIQNLGNLTSFFPAQTRERPANPVVIGPFRLIPGFYNRLIFVQGVGCQADILQMLQPAQDGHQKFQNFYLGRMGVVLLLQMERLETLDQTDILCKPALGDQKSVLGMLCFVFNVAHDHSLLD
jgi:hypothetical protein